MQLSPNTVIHLGAWQIHPSLNRIRRHGATVRLTPKVMQVLLCLIEQQGDLVSREYLLDTVWTGTVVNEDVLTRAISDLRKAFEDNPQHPQVIETIPKAGYRLITLARYEYPGDALPTAGAASASLPALSVPPGSAAATRPAPWRWLAILALMSGIVGLAAWLARRPPPSIPPAPVPAIPVTSMRGWETFPLLSPDGSRVAFTARDDSTGNWDLYVKLIGTEGVLRLTDHPAPDAGGAWSPDGQRIVFARYADNTCTLYVVPVLGGSARKLAPCYNNANPELAWSPDGQWIAYSDQAVPDESYSIFLLSVETLETRRLTAPNDQHWGDKDPSFSPDGTLLSFTTSVSMATQDIFIIPIDGGPAQRLTYDAQTIGDHAWTADGRSLVFTSDRGGGFDLWQVPASGGTPRWVPTPNATPRRLATDRQRGRLIYEQRTAETNIRQLQLGAPDTVEETAWQASTRVDRSPHLSPDGSRVAFISNRSGSDEVWVGLHDGTALLQLTSFKDAAMRMPRWSPDGQYLAFDARREGHVDLYLVDAEGGTPQRLTTNPANEVAPGWSTDGQWVYYGSNRTGRWEIWKVPVTGGQALQITTEGGYAAMEAPDGSGLYYTKYDHPGLWYLTFESGHEAAVAGAEGFMDWGNWGFLGGDLYLGYQEAPGYGVYRLHPATSTRTLLIRLAGSPGNPGLTLSADGLHLFYATVERVESDLMLLEHLP